MVPRSGHSLDAHTQGAKQMTSHTNARNRIRRRELGLSGALDQSTHAAVNRRYPGLTREHCWICDDETGRAGRHDDSIYDLDDNGPYCEACFANHPDRFEGYDE